MQNKRNYYRVLHLQPDAPQAMVRAAYRTIMQKLKAHPDLGGDEWNASLINEAYEVLSDVNKRAAYDKNFFAQRSKKQASNQFEEQRGKETDTESKKAGNQQTPGKSKDQNNTTSSGQNENAEQFSQEYNDYDGPGRADLCLFCGSELLNHVNVDETCSTCQSPIDMQAINTQSGVDRRESLRMPSGSQIHYQIRSQYHAQKQAKKSNGAGNVFANAFQTSPNQMNHSAAIIDISLSGIRLQCSHSLKLGEILRLESPKFIALAQVKNCLGDRPNTYGTQFISLKFKNDRGSFVSTAV